MRSQVYFGRTFALDPKSKTTWSISSSLIWIVSCISYPVRKAFLPTFQTIHGSSSPAHQVINSCSPFTALVSLSKFMQVSKKMVSIEVSFSDSN